MPLRTGGRKSVLSVWAGRIGRTQLCSVRAFAGVSRCPGPMMQCKTNFSDSSGPLWGRWERVHCLYRPGCPLGHPGVVPTKVVGLFPMGPRGAPLHPRAVC
eukprot:9172610-Pyramimonas_sp.AAC.1